MILVDSSVWIDLLRDRVTLQTELLIGLLGRATLATGDLMLAEVLQGCTSDATFEQARRLMTANLAIVPIVDFATAILAARNYRALRARGITVRKTIDVLIATRCIVEGYALLYADRDFDPFVEHLGLISALADPPAL
ncbi:PIN domain nuclease [Sphingomonas koreensis]|nr:PIN domain nuclease [Sphingomonas koreensis]